MDVVGIIEKTLGKKAIIDFKPMQPGDVKESFAEVSKSNKMLNFVPKTSIGEGIPLFVKWYKHYKNINN